MTSDEHTQAYPADGRVLAPYSGPHEPSTDLLLRHDWLLKSQIARSQGRKPTDLLASPRSARMKCNGRSTSRQPSAAPQPVFAKSIGDCTNRLQIDARVEQSRLHGVGLPMIELAERFALTAREIDLLFACLAVELDRRYERVYGFLHDDMSRRLASPGLAIGLYCDAIDEQLSARALLNPPASLRYMWRITFIGRTTTSCAWSIANARAGWMRSSRSIAA